VCRVGEQRERREAQATDDLADEERRVEPERDPQEPTRTVVDHADVTVCRHAQTLASHRMTLGRCVCRVVVASALVLGGLVMFAAPALAHIDPDPKQVTPGKRATVAFNVEHGCGTSPTTKLTFKIPKGATKVSTVPKQGWTGTVKKTTVTFAGGPLDAKTPDTFSITFTAPKKKTVLFWFVVQDCEQGTTRWIDRSKGAEFPPPAVGVGKKPPAVAEVNE
jgi:periplasmic copper chaperone A